jgi:hypothetical protein
MSDLRTRGERSASAFEPRHGQIVQRILFSMSILQHGAFSVARIAKCARHWRRHAYLDACIRLIMVKLQWCSTAVRGRTLRTRIDRARVTSPWIACEAHAREVRSRRSRIAVPRCKRSPSTSVTRFLRASPSRNGLGARHPRSGRQVGRRRTAGGLPSRVTPNPWTPRRVRSTNSPFHVASTTPEDQVLHP